MHCLSLCHLAVDETCSLEVRLTTKSLFVYQATRVTSNYDNPSLPWVTFMPILWNTTEGDQFQKYTKESIFFDPLLENEHP